MVWADRARALWRVLRTPLTLAALAIISIAIGQFVARYWSALADHRWQLHVPWVFVAVISMTVFFTLHASAWRASLVWTGLRLPWRQGLWAWSRASLARYLPTPLWVTGSRIYGAMQLGASWRSAALCFAAELGGTVAVALGLSLLALPAWTGIPSFAAAVTAAATVLIALPLTLVILSRWRWAGRAMISIGPLQAVAWCGTYAGSFLLFGAAHLAVLNALAVPAPPPGITIGVAVLAWALGTINVFSPSGIGTRELVLIYGLQGYVDPPDLLALAALTRLAAVAAELLLFALLAIRQSRRDGSGQTAPATPGADGEFSSR